METEVIGLGSRLIDVYGALILNNITLFIAVWFLWRQHKDDITRVEQMTEKYHLQAAELTRLQEKLHATLESIIKSISLEEVVKDTIHSELRKQ